MTPAILARWLACRREGLAAALVTDLAHGTQSVVTGGVAEGDLAVGPALAAAVAQALTTDRSAVHRIDDREFFIEVAQPPLRLIVVGAVHIAQALAQMAVLTGYQVTIIDPRGRFATAERFPGIAVIADWPDEVIATLKPDHRTAIVTLTHDPKIDDPALVAALASPAFYIGALGSRRTQAKRLERLAAAGLDPTATARIHGPVGLAIGAVTQAEIAVSILAGITAVLRRAPA